MRRQRPADFVGVRPVWCLDLRFGGTVYRVASEPVDVQASDGTMHSYTGGLEPVELVEQLGRLKFTTPELVATIQAVLPVSAAELRARGYDWLSATADLFLTMVDTEDARLTVPSSKLSHAAMWLQISGRVQSPEWGFPGRPAGAVEFTVRSVPWDHPGGLVNSLGELTAARWPGADSEAIGKRYPLIIGHPGVYLDADGNEAYGAGSPAYVVARTAHNADTLLAAGHPRSGDAQVVVTDEYGNTYSTVALNTEDGDGNAVCTVDVSGASASFSRSGVQFYVAWSGAGGITSDLSAGPLEAAHEVAAYLLRRAGMRVDVPAWLALAGQIPTVKVGGYVNDDTAPWEYLQRHVLPLMPVAYRYTRQGLAPVVYSVATRQAEAVAHVRTVDTPDASSSGDWTPVSGMALDTEPEDVPLQLDVRMAADVRTGQPPRVLSWVGTGAGPVDRYRGPRSIRDKSGSIYLDHAATRGATELQELNLEQVWDTPSVDAVASWRTRLATMPTVTATYSAPLHWGWLQVGDVVVVTDPLRALAEAFAIIDGKVLDGGAWRFVLLFDEDPVRDARAVF